MLVLEQPLPASKSAVWLPPSRWPTASEHLFTPGPYTPGPMPGMPGVITQYDTVRAVLMDRDGRWSRHVPEAVIPPAERHATLYASWGADGAEHRMLRQSLNGINRGSTSEARTFTKARTRALMQLLMQESQPWDLSRVIYQVSMDLVIRHTLQAPMLLPYARTLREFTREHVSAVGGFFGIKRQPKAEDILRQVITSQDSLPRDGLAYHLVHLMNQGQLSEKQVIGQLWLICVSQETQATAAASLLGMLLEFDELGYVRSILDDPDAMKLLVNEAGRRAIVFPVSLALAAQETILDGHSIAQGEACLLSYAAANLDPTRFDRPLVFDPRAPREWSHLAFGEGRHRCQGEHGADEFMHDVIRVLAQELPRGVRLDDDILLRETGISMAISKLPLTT